MSSTALKYEWMFEEFAMDGKPSDITVPFRIEPAAGEVGAQQEQVFTLSFNPLESGDYNCTLKADMPNLDEEMQPPLIKVRARGLRPKIHFDLEPSDYLTANRRKPGMAGPSGQMVKLDPAT